MALRENKLSFSPRSSRAVAVRTSSLESFPVPGKIFKRVRQLLSLRSCMKNPVLVDPVNTCVRDTQPKRIIVENHGYTFSRGAKCSGVDGDQSAEAAVTE